MRLCCSGCVYIIVEHNKSFQKMTVAILTVSTDYKWYLVKYTRICSALYPFGYHVAHFTGYDNDR